jgi:hypothetical protein
VIPTEAEKTTSSILIGDQQRIVSLGVDSLSAMVPETERRIPIFDIVII